MTIKFRNINSNVKNDEFVDTILFFVSKKIEYPDLLEKFDKESNGSVKNAIKACDFDGKSGSSVEVFGKFGDFSRILIVGIGEKEGGFNNLSIQNIGGKLFKILNAANIEKALIYIPKSVFGYAPEIFSAEVAFGFSLRSYKFNKYFVDKKDKHQNKIKEIILSVPDQKKAKESFSEKNALAEGVFLARDVVSEPPNILNPKNYADICKELKLVGVKVEVLGEKQLEKLGMKALLGVGQGSVSESQVVVMQWIGKKDSSAQPIAFVGKGVTFDTGGISLKPSNGMEDMKYDMGGSASVVGVMKALAMRKADVNAIGVIGLVENMPGGNAQRPSDVVTSMSGQTIEVLNTDAEGRLVLADCLWYTQKRFKPKFIIDLATLTGAIVVTLGMHRAGTFSNDKKLADQLYKTGEEIGERVWELPLGEEYDKQIDSKIADVQNISNTRGGGSITAAQFLQRFVNKTPWVHIDIAGVAWKNKADDLHPEGASGFGVRLLDRLVKNYYED